MTMENPKRYIFGIIVSFVLATWIAFLAIVAVITPNLGWGAVALLTGAIVIGGPLAILLLVTWGAYMIRDHGQVPGRAHALIFLPTLLALSIFPVSQSIEQGKADRFGTANPAISETHVNLSGSNLWLDTRPSASTSSGGGPDMPLSAENPERFSTFRRWPNPDTIAAGLFPYEGSRLKDGIDRYTYRSMTGEALSSLPLHRFPYPDLRPFFPILGEEEAPRLTYLYFHYADHVEVVPSLSRLSGMTEQKLEEKKLKGLVQFRVQNYMPASIARLEVNGQGLDIGEWPVKSMFPKPAQCRDFPQPVGGAFVDIDQPLSIRWQTVNKPQIWHSATLRLPAFRQQGSLNGESTLLRALLYFLPDETVEGERYVEVRLSNGAAIRATGMPEEAIHYASCGSAYDNFNPQRVKLLAE
ncbi:hypothetical protein [Agrobacterium sp. NPDC089420]|uniref:hypothetical protein n=1 Tax=Agrobacterium sp. NPDC089420 TaxID=3363918 RepID=UPI00384F71B3